MIKNRLDADLKQAMLARDSLTVSVLRGLKSAILYAEVAAGSRDQGLDDDAIIAVLQKEAKKRAESVALYRQGGAEEKASTEEAELAIIQTYLPKQLDATELEAVIDQVLADLAITTPTKQDTGKIIAGAKQQAGGSVDGAQLAQLVSARIARAA